MSDFVQQRIPNFLRRIMTGVVFCDLNSSITEFAHTLPTFRRRQSKRPISKSMLQEFPRSKGFQFPQIHTSIPVYFLEQRQMDLQFYQEMLSAFNCYFPDSG